MGEKPREEENKLEPEGSQKKTDWSRSEEILKRRDDEKRAKMSPEEIAEDDRRKERVESTHRFFERERMKKTGIPVERKRVEEEEAEEGKKLHKKIEDIIVESDKKNAELREELLGRTQEKSASMQREFEQRQKERSESIKRDEEEIQKIEQETGMSREQMHNLLYPPQQQKKPQGFFGRIISKIIDKI